MFVTFVSLESILKMKKKRKAQRIGWRMTPKEGKRKREIDIRRYIHSYVSPQVGFVRGERLIVRKEGARRRDLG